MTGRAFVTTDRQRAYLARWRRENPNYNRGWKYGLTAAQVASLGQCCGICDVAAADTDRPMCIDHDETTGIIRGLLCTPCNVGIGLFDHDPARLERAASYLRYSDTGFRVTRRLLKRGRPPKRRAGPGQERLAW